MTSTNRFANRFLLFLVGFVLLVSGLGAVALMLIPALATSWNQSAPQAMTTTESVLRGPSVPGTGISWVLTGALALFVILIVLLVIFIVRQGRGHTRRLVVQKTSKAGTTIIESQVAVELVQDALAGEPELLATHVTAYRVRGSAALKITVTCRRGASPSSISSTIEQLLVALDGLVGVEIPTLVQISGGFRTRLSASARLDQAVLPSRMPLS